MAQYEAEEAALLAEEEALLKEEELLRQLDENPDLIKELNPSFFEKLQGNEEVDNLQKLIDENQTKGNNQEGERLQGQMQTMMITHMAQRRKEIAVQKKEIEEDQMRKYLEQEAAADEAKKRIQEQMVKRKKELEEKKKARGGRTNEKLSRRTTSCG